MNQLEENVVESFRLVKNDIMKLQESITMLSQNQERLMGWIQDTRDKETMLYTRMKDLKVRAEELSTKTPRVSAMPKKVVKVISVAKRAKASFVASKAGNKVHIESCPFAKNIKPKSKIVFHSKAKAFNTGFKPCECMKRV